MTHALALFIVVLAAAPLASRIPLAALAGILVWVAWDMGEWREFARLRQFSFVYRSTLLTTFALTVIFDLVVAVEVGLVLSSATGDQKPLAEARVGLATDRTVAIAVPGAVAGDWMVLGVTPLEPSLAAKRVHESSGIPREGDGEVSMPKLLHRVTTDYPQGAKAERLAGKIVLMLLIDREGIPRAPAILDMTPGTEELAAAAVDAVLQWRYEPAKRRGEAFLVHRVLLRQAFHRNSRWDADTIGNELLQVWESLPEQRRLQIEASASQHTPFSILPEVIRLLEG